MQAHCTRLFSDENGASRFEELTIELQQVFSAPGLETSIFSAPFLVSEGSLWIGAPATWKDERLHQAPRRMIQVTTQGEYQVTTSEGVIRRFPVGAVKPAMRAARDCAQQLLLPTSAGLCGGPRASLKRLDRIFTDHPVYGSRRLQV